MPPPVTLIEEGGLPVTNAAGGLPLTPVADGGRPVTLTEAGGLPVTLVNEDLTPWEPEED